MTAKQKRKRKTPGVVVLLSVLTETATTAHSKKSLDKKRTSALVTE